LKYPISPMPDDETLPCGDLWEEISQDDPREGNTRSDPHREDGAVRLSSSPAGRNQEKAHQVFPPPFPIFPSGKGWLGRKEEEKRPLPPQPFYRTGLFSIIQGGISFNQGGYSSLSYYVQH